MSSPLSHAGEMGSHIPSACEEILSTSSCLNSELTLPSKSAVLSIDSGFSNNPLYCNQNVGHVHFRDGLGNRPSIDNSKSVDVVHLDILVSTARRGSNNSPLTCALISPLSELTLKPPPTI